MEKEQINDYAEAVRYLERTPRFTKKNTMEDTRAFLAKLGNPGGDRKIIHVAGTNGKGSVCAYLRSILEEAGYTCGVFTSPHLVEARERFYVGGGTATEEQFYRAFRRVHEALDWDALRRGGGYHPTFFEFLFFMAMLLFEWEKPDYCILETGLGGRLDATNAVPRKEAAVITRIGYDHMEYLGKTLPEIAGEKAGIIAKGTPVAYLDADEEVSGVIRKTAAALGAPLYPLSKRDYTLLNFKNKNIDFSYHSRYYDYIRLRLHTIALYQAENAALAVKAAEALGRGRIDAGQIAAGLLKTFWAGRMEEVEPDVFVDGAHNPDGIRAFLETVREDGLAGGRHLLFGAVRDKDYARMAKDIAESGLFDTVRAVQMRGERALRIEELKEVFARYAGREIPAYGTVAEAYAAVKAQKKDGERVYVAGSLYLVGAVKELLERCGYDKL